MLQIAICVVAILILAFALLADLPLTTRGWRAKHGCTNWPMVSSDNQCFPTYAEIAKVHYFKVVFGSVSSLLGLMSQVSRPMQMHRARFNSASESIFVGVNVPAFMPDNSLGVVSKNRNRYGDKENKGNHNHTHGGFFLLDRKEILA